MHDATKVVLGSTRSSFRKVDNKKGSIEAGLAVRLKSDKAISIAKADGGLLGISIGEDMSKAGHTNICRSGLEVPILLTDGFTPVLGQQVFISDTTGKAGATGAGFTGVNAIYASGLLSGIKEDGVTLVNVATIDMQGGL